MTHTPTRSAAVPEEVLALPRDTPGTAITTDDGKPARRRRAVLTDVAVYLMFIGLAVWITSGLWPTSGHHVSSVDAQDQAFFEWMLSHGARVLTHFDSPWFTDRMNVPTGVNLMANTSILALSLPMAPITLWLGPDVSYAMVITLGLAATAGAWYFVLRTRILPALGGTDARSSALIGALIAGFGPGIVAHANGHPNLVSQFLIPFIAWRVLRFAEPGRNRMLRNGVALGLLVTVQVFINEELLFVTALVLGVYVGAWALLHRDRVRAKVRPILGAVGVTLVVAGGLLAYPLWLQFFGPASYRGLDPVIQNYGTDIASIAALGERTLIGGLTDTTGLAPNPAEQNGFLGWPLLILLAVSIYWVRRNRAALAVAITAFVMTLLSLGPRLRFDGHRTPIPGPFALLRVLPLFDSLVPTRLSLAVLPLVAVLVAIAHERVRTVEVSRYARPRLAWLALIGIALVSFAPTPVPTTRLQATPAFITDGIWRKYVSADQTVVPVPLPQYDQVTGLFWAAGTELALQLPRGYFLGPDPARHDIAIFGAPSRHTSVLLAQVIAKDKAAVVKPADRRAAIADLQYWHAAVVIQVPGGPADHAVRATMNDLLGFKPKLTGGVWVWDVRKLVASHRTVLG
jgi:hypothetical protein